MGTRAEPRRALVTGATGFLGSHLARRLAQEGWTVHLLARPSSDQSMLAWVDAVPHLHHGTIADMQAIMAAARPSVVFHLASLFLSRHSPAEVEPLVASNILLPAQLAEAMAGAGVRHLVNTGTSWQHFQDEDYSPTCLYAATKQAFADLLAYWTGSGSLDAVTLELFDTYGPGDRRPKLFSLLRQAAATGTPLEMSPGEQLVDMVFVDDVVEGYLAAAERLLAGKVPGQETYALSSGAPLPLRELVGLYGRVTGREVPVEWGRRAYRPREVMVPWSRGKALPGWAPRVGLEEGIRRMEGLE